MTARRKGGVAATGAPPTELPMRAFSRSLPMELLRAREAVMKRFRPALRDHGVTEQQWRILRALAHSGALEVSALAGGDLPAGAESVAHPSRHGSSTADRAQAVGRRHASDRDQPRS